MSAATDVLISACPDARKGYCARRPCPDAVRRESLSGRWYITMGHVGFNNPANNGKGYKSYAIAMNVHAKTGVSR